MKKIFFYLLALTLYYTGDVTWSVIAWLQSFYWSCNIVETSLWNLYQKCMSLSLKYDEIAGYKIWKLPDET